MAVKRYKDTEWGTTKRVVHGGTKKFITTIYWKLKDGRWVEIIDHSKVPIEVRKDA